ncbi:MAG: hypothetical protein Phyf2KO_09100 [Phycisphaerales bacterium]
MVQADPYDVRNRLSGSQAGALLAQGELGKVLINRAHVMASDPNRSSIPFPADQAHALRSAVAALPGSETDGDAA